MAAATLLCRQCNFENEPERVYCHNCGAKLDRSLLPPEATRREDPVVVQERVRKMVNPSRGPSFQQVKNLIWSLLTAAVAAALLLMIKPPAGIPDLSKEAVMSAPAINDDMASLEETPGARPVRYLEDQVNAYLQHSRVESASSKGGLAKFERAYVHFHEGNCSITSVESILGFPIYATTTRTAQVQNGAIVSRVLGGSLGSLKVPAFALPYYEGIFGPLWKGLEQNRALVARLQTINFHDKAVDLYPKAAGR